jgi:hypothetical protein
MKSIQISNPQKRKIKELVDQIIVNRGVLPNCKNVLDIDGMNGEQLCQFAFKFYKMIYLGESPLDIDLKIGLENISDLAPSARINTANCIGCDKPLTEEDGQMPVCRSCRSTIKADYDMLKTLMH